MMNKIPLLEKFAAQSLVYVDTGLDDGKELIFSKEKFAELIVRECMSIVENYPIDPEDMPYNGRIIPYMIFVQEKMQLHFGVEE